MKNIIKLAALAFLFTLVGFVVGVKLVWYTEEQNVRCVHQESFEVEIFNAVNQARVEAGVPILSPNSLLEMTSDIKARDLFAREYWSHEDPEGNKYITILDEIGYNYHYAGENLARDFCGGPASDVVDSWMNSAAHRKNLLYEEFEELGVGVYDIYIVTHYGKKVRGGDYE